MGGHPPETRAMAEAAFTALQMKTLIKEGKDAYKLLGVTRESTPNEVEKAYRRKCLEWRPDKWGTKPEADQKKAAEANIGVARDILHSTDSTAALYLFLVFESATSADPRLRLRRGRRRAVRTLLLANGSESSKGNGMEPTLPAVHFA